MPNPFRRSAFEAGTLIAGLLISLLSFTAPRAIAQTTPAPLTPLEKQLNRVDFYFGAIGILNDKVSGLEQRDDYTSTVVTTLPTTPATTVTTTTFPTQLSIRPSNSVGELVTLRYVAKRFVGFEFNYSNARLTQNYTFATPVTTTTTVATTPPTTTTANSTTNLGLLPGGAQTSVHEETLGYVAHPWNIFGVKPYLGAGGGTIHFVPTPYGGEHLPFQYRAVFYYNAGLDYTFPDSHLGIRAGFRQLIYLAPDFEQNYLTITRRVRSSEPTFGFFLRF